MSTAARVQPKPVSLLVRYFRVVWSFSGSRAMILLTLMVMTSFTEAIGITLFLPFLSQTKITTAGNDRVSAGLGRLFARLGGTPSPKLVLALILAVFFLKGVITFVAMVYQAHVNSKLFQEIRRRMIAAYARMDYRYYLQKHSGYFVNAITVEVNRAVTFFSVYLTVLSYLINLVLFLAVSMAVNFEFTCVAIVFGGAVIASFKFVSDPAARYSFQQSDENARFHTLLIETIQSFKYLASTGGFGRLQDKLSSSVTRLVDIELKLHAVSSVVHAFSEPITVSGLVALIYYEVVIQGRPMSSLVVAFMLFFRAMTAITGFQKTWQTLAGSAGGIETVLMCSEDLEAHREEVGGRPVAALTQGVEFRDVSFSYGDKQVLSHCSFRIPRNTLVAFVGDSGAGKSTMVDLITGLLKPVAGSVLIDGVDIHDLDVRELRKRIGYVTQEGVLFDDTIARNISMWSCDDRQLPCQGAIEVAAERAQCADFVRSQPEGYQSIIGDRGVRLSGGQRQRLSIARELFKQPELLILDEATSALDAEAERLIQKSIEGLRGHATVVVIAHRLSTIRGCDQIFVLEGGTVVEQGSFVELAAQAGSWFARMCSLQNTIRA